MVSGGNQRPNEAKNENQKGRAKKLATREWDRRETIRDSQARSAPLRQIDHHE